MGFKYDVIERTPPKIVQIACDEYRLYGLTKDGDVWQYASDGSCHWDKLPPLPIEDEVAPVE